MTASAWRPPQWSQPQLYSVTVTQATSSAVTSADLGTAPGQPVQEQTLPASSGPAGATSQSTTYYFDAVLSADHYTTRRFTDHPIQSGASVVDHSFQMPDRVILEVGYSDAMQSYQSGQFGGPSKSVSAYQQFVKLQKSGAQLQLSTRLQSYPVMGIEEIRASDNYITAHGAKFSVVFKQIIIANLATTPAQSSRLDSSSSTNVGSQNPSPVPSSTTSGYSTTPNAATPASAPNNPNPNPDWRSDPIAPSSLGIMP
jgi:hypothetical protein